MGSASENKSIKAMGAELSGVLPGQARPWYTQKHLLKLNLSLLLLFMLSSAVGFDGSLMNGFQALPQWNSFMDSPNGAWLGFINAIYWLAVGVTSPISAWSANKHGRKNTLYAGYVLLILATCMQTASQNQATFIVARFFLGMATAVYGNVTPLLTTECAHPSHRGIMTALYNSGFYLGAIVAAWSVFGTRNYASSWAWRLPSILQIACPLVALPGLLLCTESPRWLISVGRTEEAHQILIQIHAAGDASSPLVEHEFNEITTTLAREKEAFRTTGYLDMIRTRGNRRRLFITASLGIYSQWIGNGVVSYYLAMVLDSVGVTSVTDQTLISACLQIWNFIFTVIGALSVDKLGRRKLFLTSFTIMLMSYIVITACSGTFARTGSTGAGLAVIPLLYIYFAGYDIGVSPLQLSYPVEIWPYHLRGRGLSVVWTSMCIGVIFNVFVNPIALAAIGWKYYIVFVVVLLVYGLSIYFVYPETRGHTLEQMADIFDTPRPTAVLDGKLADKVESVEPERVSKAQMNTYSEC